MSGPRIRWRLYVEDMEQEFREPLHVAIFLRHQLADREPEIYFTEIDAALFRGAGLSVRAKGAERICQVVVGDGHWPHGYQLEHLRALLDANPNAVEAVRNLNRQRAA